MVLEEAKQFIGREVRFHTTTGKIVRVSNVLNRPDGEFIVAQLDNGFVVNIELLREEVNGNWEKLKEAPKVSHS